MSKILKLLEKDARLSYADMAVMLGMSEKDVAAEVARLEREGVIVGYRAVIDWDKTNAESVTALIDVKITPQRDRGFDRVAERIYQFDEVESLYLMSGGYDLSVLITGRTLKEVALFVSQKLSALESVSGTATHFILKRYKDGGMIYERHDDEQEGIQLV
ncbi:AsnC family transcriptional regulator [Clostridia bacterium]|nr:AsnC family transcriptional regulator [Clostridia bacterium]